MEDSSRVKFPDNFGQRITVSGHCEKHGDWERESRVGVPEAVLRECHHCNNEARQAAEDRKRQAELVAAENARLDRLEASGIGPRHLGKTFDAFFAENEETRNALQRCQALVDAIVSEDERPPSLILCGNPGTGKSHLGCSMVIAVSDAGYSAKRISISDLIREFKATWSKDSEVTETTLLNYYGRIHLLVIEEIGVQHGSDTERMFLFEVMNRRYEWCVPTVLISNLDPKRISEEVGDRVMDRLREDGGRMIRFTGKSWRAQ